MSRADGGEQDNRENGQDEQELATKMLQIQSKRFYLNVKENRRGRFIKIAEIIAGGRKSHLILSMSASAEFRNQLSEFCDYYSTLGSVTSGDIPEDGLLKTAQISGSTRRYYLDLKENQRGRFLRVSQTQSGGGPRSQIAIPAEGMVEVRDALNELLGTYGTDDHEASIELPENKSMRVENKTFYFDIGQNNRGAYMRISEVGANFRTAITVPERAWPRLRDIVNDYIAIIDDGASGSGGAKPSCDGDAE